MKPNIKRREAITKAAVVAGALLAVKAEAAPLPWWEQQARDTRKYPFAGPWVYQGRPCAIFQEGFVIIAVNEAGNLGTAQVTGPNQITLIGGGWETGLVGVLDNSGRTINWSNDTVWTRG